MSITDHDSNDLSWLDDKLNGIGAPLIIDGGMGTELERAGVPMDSKVWSATAVLSHPHTLRRTHEKYIEAGAEVIIANSFAAASHMLAPAGLGDQVRAINVNAVDIAKQARANTAIAPVAIAGSICEWTSSEDPNWHRVDAVADSAREQAEILASAGVDLIALEMCELIDYSIAVIEAAREVNLPLWIGVSARSFSGQSTLSVFDEAGLDFESLVRQLAPYPAAMMTIMHTPINDIDTALAIVKRYWSGPVGIYPESGYFTMPNWQFVDIIGTDALVREARSWVDQGVRMVGGCCGLGPEHIAALRAVWPRAKG